jgi:hypothetical protein
MPIANRILAGLACLLLLSISEAPVAAEKGARSMNPGSTCGKTALAQSMCMIEAVVKDVKATYTHVGGGGITEIKLVATKTYTVSISQEERVDLITYEFDIKPNGQLVLLKRSEDARTPKR